MYRRWGKRACDLALVIITGPLTLAGIVTIWILSLLLQGPPVLLWQERIGKAGKTFKLVKFRTMRPVPPEESQEWPDADRLTAFGRVLRSASLDELPSIWNVICGHMSVVGPRPLLPEYWSLYTREQARRHEVTPGLTGWAQVNGRNALSWEDKFDRDVWYVDHQSLWLDLKIVAITPVKVLAQEGVRAQGHATMPRFKGSRSK